ncbi:L-alanine exporter AlaE [invertebrate metagenome]|uniref:L-alanine exporter AlaE n=1 Tax=invertebrate metagenome TaxID=1711999 RepID=A0A2H9TB17_9ZZZZ
MKIKVSRYFLADTIALMIFTFISGISIEVGIAGFTIRQSLISRLLCVPVNLGTARPYGMYRDAIQHVTEKLLPSTLQGTLSDIIAYVSFQLPLYIVILLFAGLSWKEIGIASVSQVTALIILGRPYGLWLEFCRKKIIYSV